jgi:hypothetical protein
VKTAAAAVLLAAFVALVPPSAGAAGGDISYSCSPSPSNCSGWYRAAVTIHFSIKPNAGNSISNPQNCGDFTQSGDTTGVSRTCTVTFTDSGGSSNGSATASVKKDGTPPQNVHADAPGGANGAGWYRSPVTFQFTGTDATSGLGPCTSVGYGGPDTTGASVTGSCTDNAGNSASGTSPSIKYDSHAPTVTGISTSRSPDSNGWFNHPVSVTLHGTDNGPSGIASCSSLTYSGPDTNGSVGGQCVDNAGNPSAPASVPFKYDATPPSVSGQPARGPDANGWFNRAVTINFGGSDFSGIASCTSTTYGGPDTSGTTLSGSCKDNAGNTGNTSYSLKFDASSPTVSGGNLSRGPDANGWYNHAVGISFAGSDRGPSGIASCTSLSYSGPDSGSASATGTCTDNAGNRSAPLSTAFKYDGSGPSVSGQPSRPPDSGGWYNHALTVNFVGNDGGGSGVAGCTSTSYSGPDGGGIGLGGSCTDKAGNKGSSSFGLNYDATAPTSITGKLDRGPDHNGWYNHPVGVVFTGSDGTSGGVSCTNVTYKGPDRPDAKVTGSCTDAAGNSASGGSLDFKYKATPPSITKVSVGVNDQLVSLSWKVSPDATSLQVTRTPGTDGADSSVLESSGAVPSVLATSLSDRDVANGKTYVYTISATDDAGNVGVDKISVAPSAVLYSPARNAVVTSPPQLSWRAISGAAYYNLQVFYVGKKKARKVLSVWPKQPRYRLTASWRYRGKRVKLAPGRYRWLVWPGYGKRTAHKYGPLMGQSVFVVVRR